MGEIGCIRVIALRFRLTVSNKRVRPLRGRPLWGRPCSWVPYLYYENFVFRTS